MPRIRRWHPVSHDLIRDREFLALLEIHDRLGYVWIEMLSEADRNEGVVKGPLDRICQGFASLIAMKYPATSAKYVGKGIEFMLNCGWISWKTDEKECLVVRNYPTFHPRREQRSSPPNVLTTLTNKQVPKDPSPELDANIRGWLDTTQHLQSLSNGKHGKYWQALERAYDSYEWLYFEEEIRKADAWLAANPNRRPTERGLPRFFRSWLERAVERGRKIRG